MDTPAPTPAPVAVPTTAPAAAKNGAQTTKNGPQPVAIKTPATAPPVAPVPAPTLASPARSSLRISLTPSALWLAVYTIETGSPRRIGVSCGVAQPTSRLSTTIAPMICLIIEHPLALFQHGILFSFLTIG